MKKCRFNGLGVFMESKSSLELSGWGNNLETG